MRNVEDETVKTVTMPRQRKGSFGRLMDAWTLELELDLSGWLLVVAPAQCGKMFRRYWMICNPKSLSCTARPPIPLEAKTTIEYSNCVSQTSGASLSALYLYVREQKQKHPTDVVVQIRV